MKSANIILLQIIVLQSAKFWKMLNFTEKVYNKKYSDGEYVFDKLYFEGLTGGGWIFDIKMEPAMGFNE